MKKLFKFACMSVLAAGILFICCGFFKAVPKGVTVNGVDIGGMSYSSALFAVRERTVKELEKKKLTISARSGEYTFTYPEISFKDNAEAVIKSAKRGEKLTTETSYYLCGKNEIASAIYQSESVFATEPYYEFRAVGEPFLYRAGNDGKLVDRAALIADIDEALKGGFERINLKYVDVKRKKTMEQVKAETVLLSSFTTYFDGTNLQRSSNIRLAAGYLNGSVIEGGKVLSFNDTVGVRSKERGFLPAKIIENGKFVEGIGGGVCQVSTTLYNCALLAGLKIKEYHPHSLAVGYVSPSRDAMVSGSFCDLKILNPLGCAAYIRAETGKNFVTFKIYGLDCGVKYSVETEVTGSVPAPQETTEKAEEARAGKDGVISRAYLVEERDGFVKKTVLRNDRYAPVKRVIYEGEPPEDDGQQEEKILVG